MAEQSIDETMDKGQLMLRGILPLCPVIEKRSSPNAEIKSEDTDDQSHANTEVKNDNDRTDSNIDPENNFEEWLKSMKISGKIIKKLKKFDLDSMYAISAVYIVCVYIFHGLYSECLQEIDRNDYQMVKEIASEMKLSSIELIKFKLILKYIPQRDDELYVKFSNL